MSAPGEILDSDHVEIIARDRAGVYAEGASRGAPDAIQVADRFHLLCNLTAAAERALQQARIRAPNPIAPPSESKLESDIEAKPLRRADQLKAERRERRVERYNEVTRLYSEGYSQKAISRTLGMQRKTVRRFLRAGQFPERVTPKRRPSDLSPFRDYLERRWKEGCHNATRLWCEIREQGYHGGRGMVAVTVAKFRAPGTKYFHAPTTQSSRKQTVPSPCQIASLFSRQPVTLSQGEHAFLKRLEAANPGIAPLKSIVQEFSTLMRDRDSQGLPCWMERATATGIPALKSFVSGLQRDLTAVTAAFSSPWSSGQVEGQVHRLKLIKRQMYGRAGFLLLSRRVLPFASHEQHRAP